MINKRNPIKREEKKASLRHSVPMICEHMYIFKMPFKRWRKEKILRNVKSLRFTNQQQFYYKVILITVFSSIIFWKISSSALFWLKDQRNILLFLRVFWVVLPIYQTLINHKKSFFQFHISFHGWYFGFLGGGGPI